MRSTIRNSYLAKFIGWELPNVVTYEGSETLLYLECIFPLFFIEQKRGWSEIQANTPTHYGIKNLKRSAAEFCLGIDSFDYEKRLTKLNNVQSECMAKLNSLRDFSTNVAEFNSIGTK